MQLGWLANSLTRITAWNTTMTVLNQILVPTDFSRNSSSALNYACDLARQSHGKMHILHVLADDQAENQREVVQHLERLGSMLDARAQLSVETNRQVLTGKPAKRITEFAKDHDIDLIVMGTHGRTGLAHLTMGSVTERVMRDASCPVLVFGPSDGVDISLNRAAIFLASEIGDGLESSKEEGFTRMLQRLADQLHIPTTTAMLIMDELVERSWIQWQDGKWRFTKGVEVFAEPAFGVPGFTSNQPAIDLVHRARQMRATDIHIDPAAVDENQVRFRIDGKLIEYCHMTRDVTDHLVNQFKNLANLDISDPFHIKEGRVRMPAEHSDLDVRLTTVPVAGGEAVAIRMLDRSQVFLSVDSLGFSDSALVEVQKILAVGDGLVLVTGPTGAGKTTTVYSMLETLSGVTQNIVSIEDPVEFALPFARQMNVDARHGITMTEGLKAILRMDPDIVFIGEIRDHETGAIGIHAATSGKLVFSTLHTRNIASTITNLRSRNLDDRSLAANLTGIINQRLVRRLCEDCKESRPIAEHQRALFQQANIPVPENIFAPAGCPVCRNTGYHGRTGVFEVAQVTENLQDAIFNGASQNVLEQVLRTNGVASLATDVLAKSAAGITSFEEAVSVRWLD